jgi:hypothetical protein
VKATPAAPIDAQPQVQKASSEPMESSPTITPSERAESSATTDGSSQKETSSTVKQSVPETSNQSESASPAPEHKPQSSSPDKSVESSTPASRSGGWKMDPIKLPADMELIETRADTRPTQDETAAKPEPGGRRPAPANTAPPPPESLVQIETRSEAEPERADNP